MNKKYDYSLIKENIKNYAEEIGVDDIGFASIQNYKSPNSIPIEELFPKAKTIIVLAFQQIDNCQSDIDQFASVGIKIVTEFGNESTYKLARFIKKQFKAHVMAVPGPGSGSIMADKKTGLPLGHVSLRHAAQAAGLGNFGRNNLILHPEMGSKVIFTAIVTDLNIESDTLSKEKICIDCDICVNQCPANALDDKYKTNVRKCDLKSRPYGVNGHVQFWTEFAESNSEKQKNMIQDEKFRRLYQALALGSEYVCFNCTKNCPIGQ